MLPRALSRVLPATVRVLSPLASGTASISLSRPAVSLFASPRFPPGLRAFAQEAREAPKHKRRQPQREHVLSETDLAIEPLLATADAAQLQDALANVNLSELTSPMHVRILRTFEKLRDFKALEEYFASMPVRDERAWATVIWGYCIRGRMNTAAQHFERLLASDPKLATSSLVSYILQHLAIQPGRDGEQRLIAALRQVGPAMSAFRLHDHIDCMETFEVKERFVRLMAAIDFPVSSFTVGRLMRAASHSRSVHTAERAMALLVELGLKPDAFCYTTLVEAHARAGEVDQIASVYAKSVADGVEPTALLFAALVTAAGQAKDAAVVTQFLTEADRVLSPEERTAPCLALASMIARGRCGQPQDARREADDLKARGVLPNVRDLFAVIGGGHFGQHERAAGALAARIHKNKHLTPADRKRVLTVDEFDAVVRFVDRLSQS
eukprot:TRINITY_DN5650_c0_g1_i1.p1 TRINITY_DN5650_c0_g1~~TRINITY_DN5650_c0_g1_i1.p1  ORF type:complete len:440 (-),score=105.98 TRINITY_DN5650_c0_g1_i1:132-1451(-)